MADKYIKKLADVLCGLIFDKRERDPEAYDTKATVRRIENGKAYVHIPGGVDETPVDLTIDAKAGDTVQVRVSGGRAWLVGNRTAPPTDDTTARVAQVTAAKAEVRAEQAEETANAVNGIANSALSQAAAAKQIADDTEQHFWFTETGADTGAHITEVTQEEWSDPSDPNYQSGGNLLARSNGMALRIGLTELLRILQDGILIGQDDGVRFKQTATGMQFIGADGVYRALISSDSTNPFDIWDVISNTHIRMGSGIELVNGQDEGLHVNGGDVTASGDITGANIGDKNWVTPSAVSCQSGKWYKVAEVTLDPGLWFIDCNALFPSTNATGTRQIRVTTETFTNGTTTVPGSVGNISVDILAGANTAQYPQSHFPVDISSQTTFRLASYQGSGSTISVTGRMYATRIK